MTDRLYYEDSHLTEFPAVVTACEQEKDYWKVALDQTAFFPEGGGQAGDTGYLGDVEVFDTHEKNGEIWHYTRQPLEVGAAPDQDAPVQQALPPALLPLEQQEIGVAWVDVEPQPAQFLREIAALLLQLLVDAKWPVRRIL